MATIAIIRHSITAGNLAGQYVGRTDQPLCRKGIALACTRAAQMPCVERVYCSPMLRARQTAALLFPAQDALVVPGLEECDFGEWEGKTHAELMAFPAYRAWIDHADSKCPPPGAENTEAFLARCRAAFCAKLAALHTDGVSTAAFVLHGGSIMAILSQLGTPARTFYEWQTQNCCGFLTELSDEGRLTVRAELGGVAQ